MTNETIQVTEQLTFSPAKYTALLSVPANRMKEVVEAASAIVLEHSLTAKNEFHITLIGFALGKQLQDVVQKLPKEQQERIPELLADLLSSYVWDFSFETDFYLIEKKYQFKNRPAETRASLIQVVHMPALADLYEYLSTAFAVRLQEPFPHITLYSKSTNPQNQTMGIGINSVSEFEQLQPKKIEI